LKQVRAEAETAAGTKFRTRNDARAGAGVDARTGAVAIVHKSRIGVEQGMIAAGYGDDT
jgi:hypothetical protein